MTHETGPARRPRVFVVQNSLWLDKRKNPPTLGPKYDLSKAEEFGDLVHLLKPEAKPGDPNVVEELKDKLKNIHEDDFLLLVGNPALIGYATAIAADYLGGLIQLLQWSNGRYTVLREENLFPEEDEQ